jgi:hypothetical protein
MPAGQDAHAGRGPSTYLVALALLGTTGLWLTRRVHRTLRRMNTTTNTNYKNLQVGFVGLGDQGAPMAIAIAEAGWPLRVWARRESSYEALGDVSYERCESVEELGRRSDVVGLCVTDDADVRQLLDDQRLVSALPPGGIVVNHGTGDPQVAIELRTTALPTATPSSTPPSAAAAQPPSARHSRPSSEAQRNPPRPVARYSRRSRQPWPTWGRQAPDR